MVLKKLTSEILQEGLSRWTDINLSNICSNPVDTWRKNNIMITSKRLRCDMAGLLRGTFVSWWYLPRIWPSFTDVQHYYHARYPTDDWHLAYMFSLVYFSVEVCLVGVFPHSVSIRWDPCVRVYAALTLASLLTRKQNSSRGDPAIFDPSEGAFQLTYGSACIIGW